jgi:hypothetical protein
MSPQRVLPAFDLHAGSAVTAAKAVTRRRFTRVAEAALASITPRFYRLAAMGRGQVALEDS